MKKKLLTILAGSMTAVMMMTACGKEAEAPVSEPAAEETVTETAKEPAAEEPAAEEETAEAAEGESAKDRSGHDIVIPAEINTIVSMAPSITRVLLDLGLSDKIVAADTNSQASYGSELGSDVVYMDMMTPDQEKLVAMTPDIVFTSGMSSYDGVDAYGSVREGGVCVADIPSSASLAAIEEDLLFIGHCVKEDEKAKALADDMEKAIEEIKAIAATIPEEEKKTVLFELYTPSADYPTIYTAGNGSYINEMIETVGAKNIAAGEDDPWPALSEEDAIAKDPQVILTADMYTPDAINVILGMSGWDNVSAIKNNAVYMIDADTVNQPNHHVIDAMRDMAGFIYPEYFEGGEEVKPAA